MIGIRKLSYAKLQNGHGLPGESVYEAIATDFEPWPLKPVGNK